MKRIAFIIALLVSVVCAKAQDATISELFGAELSFYAQQFDGQKYLIMKFKSSDDCIALSNTVMKVQFKDGSIARWSGYYVNSFVNSKANSISTELYSSTTVEEKAVNFMRFDLTDADIESLGQGISKIAIYTVPKVFRKEYEKDKLGKKLYEAFNALDDF